MVIVFGKNVTSHGFLTPYDFPETPTKWKFESVSDGRIYLPDSPWYVLEMLKQLKRKVTLQLPSTHMLVLGMEEKLVEVVLSKGLQGVPSLTEPQAIGGPHVPCLWQKRVQGRRLEV